MELMLRRRAMAGGESGEKPWTTITHDTTVTTASGRTWLTPNFALTGITEALYITLERISGDVVPSRLNCTTDLLSLQYAKVIPKIVSFERNEDNTFTVKENSSGTPDETTYVKYAAVPESKTGCIGIHWERSGTETSLFRATITYR